MNQNAVVTGAGSGVGQAVAIRLAQSGWRVALVGRRVEALEETARQAAGGAGSCFLAPCDIRDAAAVARMAERVQRELGDVEVLVNAAGTNTPRRSLAELSLLDYQDLLNTNLHGAYLCTQAFLPGMRRRGSGTIVNVVSEAGKQASPKSGAAYAMSKFGLAGLTQSINAEERAHGVRACAVFPGDIDTPLLDKRPQPPTAEARARMLQCDDVAECVLLCLRLPARAIVEEIFLRPR